MDQGGHYGTTGRRNTQPTCVSTLCSHQSLALNPPLRHTHHSCIHTTHTPTNRGYEGEINLSYGAIAERTTDPRVPVRTTSRS